MRNETEIKYGLRHVPTGRVVRLDVEHNGGRRDCGEETCTLSLQRHHPRFEVDDMRALLPVLTSDVNWYNTSRERPGWGKIDPKDLEVVQLMRTLMWEEGAMPSADPVYVTDTVARAPFPGFADATRFEARKMPLSLYRSYFGVELDSVARTWTEVAPIHFGEGQSPEGAVGKFVSGGSYRNSGLILAVADLPEDYPLEGRGKAVQKEGGRLHLAIINIRHVDGPEFVLTPVEESRLAP